MSRKVIFKTYNQEQLSLFPPSYDDLVPENHPVPLKEIARIKNGKRGNTLDDGQLLNPLYHTSYKTIERQGTFLKGKLETPLTL